MFRLLLVLARLYAAAPTSDLVRLDFLKKAALDILESADFADPRGDCALTLGVLLRSHAILSHSPSSATTPPVSPKEINHVELLKKQLSEDSALLRRISRVEGCAGIDCKSIIQSGISNTFKHFSPLFIV